MGRPRFTRQQAIAAFWSKVDRSGGPDACWPWLGTRIGPGYGQVSWGGRPTQATHVALLLAGRPLSPGQDALHTCDNPPCCNDAHLFGGTQLENAADAREKGRLAVGERNAWAKLTAESVRSIRARSASGESGRSLGDQFGVTKGAIYHVLAGRTWAHVE